MNINTGHLINKEMVKEMMEKGEWPRDFEPVPEELEAAAIRKLDGKSEAMVSLTSGGKLSRWARAYRRKNSEITKSNNPANIASAKAKESGLSYWSYMAKEFPGCVRNYVWPTKKTKRTRAEKVESAVNRSRGRNAMAFLMGIRGLVSGRY